MEKDSYEMILQLLQESLLNLEKNTLRIALEMEEIQKQIGIIEDWIQASTPGPDPFPPESF